MAIACLEVSLETTKEAEQSSQLAAFGSFLSKLQTDFEIDEVS